MESTNYKIKEIKYKNELKNLEDYNETPTMTRVVQDDGNFVMKNSDYC